MSLLILFLDVSPKEMNSTAKRGGGALLLSKSVFSCLLPPQKKNHDLSAAKCSIVTTQFKLLWCEYTKLLQLKLYHIRELVKRV